MHDNSEILRRLVNRLPLYADDRRYARVLRGFLMLAILLSSMAAQAAFNFTRTSAPVFFMDTSVTPNLTCNYQSIAATSTTAVADAWAEITTFTGPLGVGGGEDGKYHFGAFAAGQTKTAFFYVCSTLTGSGSAGGYTVSIYDRDPGLLPKTLLGSSAIALTIDNTVIQANSNTVNVIFSGPNPGVLGGIITMTVEGSTGTIGCTAPSTCSGVQRGPLAFTPAAYADWRSDAYELVGSNVTLTGGNSGSFDNVLYIDTLPSSSNTSYTARYFFRAVSTTSVTTSLSPVGYIASGNQIKHTSTTSGAYAGGLQPIEPASNTVSMTKLVSANLLPAQGGRVTYTARLANNGADPVSLDSIVDVLPSGATYVSGSSSYGGITIGDPIVSGTSRIWSGVFTVPASGTRDLIFQADLPATPGTYVNSVSGRISSTIIDATLSTSDNTPATATTIVLQAPVITKSFSPSALAVNGVSLLTLTLSNPNPAHALNGVAFSDSYPPGLVNAATPNAATTCSGGAPVTTVSSIAKSSVALAAGASCTVTVNVTASLQGIYPNTTGTVSSTNGGNGNAASAIVIFTNLPTISKSFSVPTMALNGTATMTLTITNNGATPLTAMAFSDTYPANLVNAATTGLTNTCGGTATGAAGAGSLTLSGGTLAVSGSCTLTINVTAATAGVYNNATSGVTSSINPVVAGPVSNTATLTVMAPPIVVKAFNLSTVGRGQTSVLTITLSNVNPLPMTGVAFTDTYPLNLVNASTPSVSTTCGGSVTANAGGTAVALAGGVIAANGSCTVAVTVTSSVVNTSPGYVNSIPAGGVISANAGSNSVAGSATLIVNATPTITKAFNVDTASGITTMVLNITNNHNAAISGVSFADTFPFGMLVDATPALTNNCGGTVAGATANSPGISLSDGSITALSPVCTISVRVRLNAGGVFSNQTTGVSVTSPFTGTGAPSNVATLAAPVVTKTFTPNTVGINDISRMELQISTGTTALTGLAISDNYPAGATNAGTFMVNAPTPSVTNTCGGTVVATAGSSSLTLTGGTLAAGQVCVIGVNVRANPATPDTYYNQTGTVRSDQGVGARAADLLTIVNQPTVTKSFLTTPVTLSGGTVTSVMRISIESNHTSTLNGVSLSDVFPTTPAQMFYVSHVNSGGGYCGGTLANQSGGALVSGVSSGIRLSGVTLAANATCIVDVTVRVTVAGSYDNQTSGATATTSGFASPGPQSNIATLVANFATPAVVKSFSAPQFTVNGTVTLTITFTNSNAQAVTGVTFTDNYPGTMMNAASPVLTNTCGGSATATTGTNSLALAAGTIPPSGSCALSVIVTASVAGALTNSTGAITTGNAGTIAAATANVTVTAPAIALAKSVVPVCDPHNFSTIAKNIPGAYVRYEITVTNGASASGSATLGSIGDMLNPNLDFDSDLRTGSASACAASSPESGVGKGFKLTCSGVGNTRACALLPVYYTTAADGDAIGISGSIISLNFGDSPAGIKALPTEPGYGPGELKPGESVTIRFNAIVK